MKKNEKQLRAIAKQLQSLAEKVEKLASLSAQEKPVKAAAKPKAKKAATAKKAAPKKAAPAKTTVLDTVFNVIKRSKKGISIANIKKKTGLETRQLSNALYKLTKKGSIKTESRGVYSKT